MVIHISAVFMGRYLFNLDTDFYFGVAGLNLFPLNLFFIPYYGLAIFSSFCHIIIALIIKTKENLITVLEERELFLIVLIGIVITSIIL